VGGAIVMVAILLLTEHSEATPRYRGGVTRCGWHGSQCRSTGSPVRGIQPAGDRLDYSIQEMICEKIGFRPYPDCPIPLAFYPVVNIALMWFGAPLAAYFFRRNVLIGLSFWGLLFANGLVHSAGGIAAGAYNTGLWSAAFLFVPFSLWVIYVCAIRGPYSGKVVAVAYAAGALTHVLLFAGYGLFKAGVIGSAGLLVYAAVIGFTPIILAAIASRFFKPELVRPVAMRPATA
jgi:hypothetical protein